MLLCLMKEMIGAAPPYQKALDESGYHYTLHYEPTMTAKQKTDNVNTSSGTTLHSAKMSTLISVTDSSPKLTNTSLKITSSEKSSTAIPSRSVTAA